MKNHRNYFYIRTGFLSIYRKFTQDSHLMYFLILFESGYIAYKLNRMREQVPLYSADNSVQLSFCSLTASVLSE